MGPPYSLNGALGATSFLAGGIGRTSLNLLGKERLARLALEEDCDFPADDLLYKGAPA
ncbi:MAG TPA: hypothetical protein VF593_00010 [Chthoniobacteraceae bacterium]|jgi:hypothetical protein